MRLHRCSFSDIETSTQDKCPVPLAFTMFFLPSSTMIAEPSVQDLRCTCMLYMYPLGPGSTTLYYDWLWFPITVYIYCKEQFPWWGVGTQPVFGIWRIIVGSTDYQTKSAWSMLLVSQSFQLADYLAWYYTRTILAHWCCIIDTVSIWN